MWTMIRLCGALLAPSADGTNAMKGEFKKLEGAWVATNLLEGGKVSPLMETVKKMEKVIGKRARVIVTFKGEKYTTSIAGKVVGEGRVKIDPTRTPKTIDMISSVPGDKGRTLLGLYKLKGDTLTWIYSPPGGKRPKKFISEKGTKLQLATLKRKTP